ncbi:MAG: tRNA pseudouridine(38-40) synthase TruA [Candidatus Kryptoniota bacterium]
MLSVQPKRNIALLIEYDGTAYSGWQIQKNGRSIQGTIEERISSLLQENIKITGAGRTDAGVHARGQVANFYTSSTWENSRLKYALNCTLPEDISIRSVANVPEKFNSRFDAVSRKYKYYVSTVKSPFNRYTAAFFPYNFSIKLMNEAASFLMGRKSFKPFAKQPAQQKQFFCEVTLAKWYDENNILIFEMEANRFLHGMVRAIVGTLLDVGRGKITIEEFYEIVESGVRASASMSAPACGLFLEEVKYSFPLWNGIHG